MLDRIALIPLDTGILRLASEPGPAELRTLDAIHLATARSLRLARAAGDAGVAVLAPS